MYMYIFQRQRVKVISYSRMDDRFLWYIGGEITGTIVLQIEVVLKLLFFRTTFGSALP